MAGLINKAATYFGFGSKDKGMASTDGAGGGDQAFDDIDGLDSVDLRSPSFQYKMDYPRRGMFIIINNKTFQPQTGMHERTGTDKDAAALHEIFRKLGFDVSLYNNQTKDKMMDIIFDASKADHGDCDCFGVAVLSHGDQDIIYGTDTVLHIDNFVEPIKMCKTLVGKPKLFIFQACRGNELDSGMNQSDATGESDNPKVVIPREADILYAYSTVPGYFSWRNSSKGSWFVQALAKVLKNSLSEGMDFVQVLTRVSNIVAYQFESNASRPEMNRKKQVPSIVSMLTKDLYLRPKVQ